MIFKKIKVKNFWSYNDFIFTFDKGLCLIEGFNYDEGGSNGAGKSAIMNALCFALFGDIPKKIKVDDVINIKNGSECLVSLELSDSNNEYLIERGRKPNVLNFYLNGTKISDVDSAKTQKLLENRLGINFDTFINSVYFSQNCTSFLFLNDENKKNILTDILNLHIFDKAHNNTKEELTKIITKIEVAISDVDIKKTLLDEINNEIKDLMTRKRFFIDDRDIRIKEIDGQIEEFNKKINKNIELQNELQNRLEKNEKEWLDFSVKKDEKKQAITLIQQEVNEKRNQLNKIDSLISVLLQETKKYKINESKCIRCYQNIDRSLLKSLEDEKNDAINDANKNKESLIKEIQSLPSITDLNTILNEINSKELSIKNGLQTIKNDINTNKKDTDLLNDRIIELKTTKEKAINEKNPYDDILKTKENNKKVIENEVQEYLKVIDLAKNKSQMLSELKEVFSNKGIKSYIYDNIINQLNFRISQYLKDLFDCNIQFNLLTEIQNSKGLMKQSITNQLTIDNQEVPISRLSGGEERRLSFAVNLAISDLISSRYMKSFNILFLDEVFDGLDIEGKEKCMILLTKLKKDCILVIDHASEFQALFNNIVKVVKKDGISHIE